MINGGEGMGGWGRSFGRRNEVGDADDAAREPSARVARGLAELVPAAPEVVLEFVHNHGASQEAKAAKCTPPRSSLLAFY